MCRGIARRTPRRVGCTWCSMGAKWEREWRTMDNEWKLRIRIIMQQLSGIMYGREKKLIKKLGWVYPHNLIEISLWLARHVFSFQFFLFKVEFPIPSLLSKAPTRDHAKGEPEYRHANNEYSSHNWLRTLFADAALRVHPTIRYALFLKSKTIHLIYLKRKKKVSEIPVLWDFSKLRKAKCILVLG